MLKSTESKRAQQAQGAEGTDPFIPLLISSASAQEIHPKPDEAVQCHLGLNLWHGRPRPSAENLSRALNGLDSGKACLVSDLGALADSRVERLTGWKPVPHRKASKIALRQLSLTGYD